jgi:hypothetical protein
VFLGLSKEAGAIFFIIAGAFILAVGVSLAYKPSFRGKPAIATVVGASLVLVVAGIAFTAKGERHELLEVAKADEYNIKHRECGAESAPTDHLANNNVSMRASIAATITVEDGKVSAQLAGVPLQVDSVLVPRSNVTNILFRNLDEEERRLMVNLGTQKVAETGVVEKVGTCTQLTGKGQENVITFTAPKPSTADQQYSFTVPGITGEIKLVVP